MLSLATLTGFSQAGESETNAPVLKLETMVVDYGTVAKGSNKTKTVKFTNTGKSPLIIISCTGSCDCTTGNCPKEPIMPGKSAELSVSYNTDKVGKFNKTVTISSNNKDGNIYLVVKGVVQE